LRADAMAETTKKHKAWVKFWGLPWVNANTVAMAPKTLTALM